jgi:hypothetical protein
MPQLSEKPRQEFETRKTNAIMFGYFVDPDVKRVFWEKE